MRLVNWEQPGFKLDSFTKRADKPDHSDLPAAGRLKSLSSRAGELC